MSNELLASQLFLKCSADLMDFSTTADLSLLDCVVGQDEVVSSLDFALRVKGGYSNIFIATDGGVCDLDFVLSKVRDINSTLPPDWCYLHNFNDPFSPIALSVPNSFGTVLKSYLLDFISDFLHVFSTNLSSDDVFNKQKIVLTRFFNKQYSIMAKISRIANNFGFVAKNIDADVVFYPIVDGVPIKDESLYDLPLETRKVFENNLLNIHKQAGSLIKKMNDIYSQLDDDLFVIDENIAIDTVDILLEPILDTFSDCTNVLNYLADLRAFMCENFPIFLIDDNLQLKDLIGCFDVNVVSYSDDVPIVVADNISDNLLIGSLPFDVDGKNFDFTLNDISSGLLHKANGGFLIVFAKDVVNSQGAFDILMKSLQNKTIDYSLIYNNIRSFTKVFDPKPIPLDLKIIVVGDAWQYDAFAYYDSDFRKLFPFKIEFDDEINYNIENISEFARAVKTFLVKENLPDFDNCAVCKVVDYASRLAENQKKLSNNFDDINEILKEASTWAEIDNSYIVNKNHVKKAIDEKYKRSKMWHDKLQKMYVDNIFMIDTSGSVVGQINGMCVMQRNGISFGSPVRITATTCMGQSGIINIEKEADLSGKTHDKGVQIISGWLGQTYAQKFQLSLCCRICFEQNYNGIDGDSASSTELYSIVSSLAEIPIRQDLAVTGSVNQLGVIQAVGGVNHKIEGFFNLCKKRGLKGSEGVIIPLANKDDLVLDDEVVSAVENGVFHIYAISTVEQGMELLMSKSCEVIHEKVFEKLKMFREC